MNDAESVPAAPSHLEGSNWQSFEWRMRRRRADRCLAVAQQALREGRPQDARAALDEAVRLVPDLSGADAVARRLTDAQVGRRSRGRWAASAVAVAIVAAGVTLALPVDWRSALEFQTRTRESAANTRAGAPARPTPPPASVRIETERVNPKVTIDSAPAAVEPPALPERRVLEARGAADDETPSTSPPAAPSRPQPNPPPLPRAAAPPVTASAQPKPQPSLPPPSSDVRVVARTEPSAEPPDTPLTAVPKPERAPDLPPPAPAGTASAPAPASNAAPPPGTSRTSTPADEEEAILAVLSRYAAAYSMLDASAARAVWPAVDERALARAFDSLASQHVSLSSCDIALVDADAAHANCSGTTTWEPKVGRGPKSQPHRWSFQLARDGSRWAIVDATVK